MLPLANRNFATYWAGFGASRAGRAVEDVGVLWLVYELTGSAVAVGFLGVARAVPSILMSPLAGVVADRVDQRRLLQITQSCGLIASLTLGVLVVTGRVEAWHLILEVAIQSFILAFDGAVRHALFPRLVPIAQIGDAVTLVTTAVRIAQLGGAVLGGLAIAAMGVAAPFFINASSYLILIACVGLIRGVSWRIERPANSFGGELSAGVRMVRGSPLLLGVLRLELVVSVFQLNPVIITLFGREVLKVGPDELGLLLGAPAMGGLAAIAGLLSLGHAERHGRFLILSAAVYGIVMATLALSPGYGWTVIVLSVAGFADALVMITRTSVMQLNAPEYMRGRVMGLVNTVTLGFGPLAQVQSGLLAGLIGPAAAAGVAGVALVVAPLLTALSPALWQSRRLLCPKPGSDLNGPSG